ncbi:sodium-dependent phosphate transport protein 2B-like isoform X2 [Liolophura sinensis]
MLLFFFICSLGLLSSAFRLLGGKTAGNALSDNELMRNPVAGLMIGVLATVLVQSSSTSTSIVVTMVASGIIDVPSAIPIVMGANIGTSVTNTIVSLGQAVDRKQFCRAFGGATVHDMFNWLTVIVLLPLEVFSGYMFRLTSIIVDSFQLSTAKGGKPDLLKTLTKPVTNLIIKLDKKVISKIAEGHKEYAEKSLLKIWCKFQEVNSVENRSREANVTSLINGASVVSLQNITEPVNVTNSIGLEKCHTLFSHLGLSDMVTGIILLIFSIFLLCLCLVGMVKLLQHMLKSHICKVIRKFVNADFPGYLAFLTGYVAIIVGAGLTILVQSSSIFTSALTPLVGLGVLKIERMYPLCLGANIGTTATGLLAALAASGDKLEASLQIALCHLFFNISGIVLFYPVPFMRKLPIGLAKMLGRTTAKYRWFSILYLLVMFFLLPVGVFGLSMAGVIPLAVVGGTFLLLIFVIVLINVLQRKAPRVLPATLKSWKFLPKWMRSLQPLDKLLQKVGEVVQKCCPCCCKKDSSDESYSEIESVGCLCCSMTKPQNRRPEETCMDESPISSRSTSVLLPIHIERCSVV